MKRRRIPFEEVNKMVREGEGHLIPVRELMVFTAYHQGATYGSLAEQFGIKPHVVKRWRHEAERKMTASVVKNADNRELKRNLYRQKRKAVGARRIPSPFEGLVPQDL